MILNLGILGYHTMMILKSGHTVNHLLNGMHQHMKLIPQIHKEISAYEVYTIKMGEITLEIQKI